MGYEALTAQPIVDEAITARVKALWESTGRNPKWIHFENREFHRPERGYWLKCEIQYGAAEEGYSSGIRRGQKIKYGLLILTIYGPPHSGKRMFLEVTSLFAGSFEGQSVGEVSFLGPDGPRKADADGAIGQQLTIPFYFHENFSASS